VISSREQIKLPFSRWGQLPYEDRRRIRPFGPRHHRCERDGSKLVALLQTGDKESSAVWEGSLPGLKGRGLDGATVKARIKDGLSGLEKVFRKNSSCEMPRCQVHVAETSSPRSTESEAANRCMISVLSLMPHHRRRRMSLP